MPSAIVPAAGASQRFGGAKLAADVDGVPLLDRTIQTLLAAGVEDVVVVIAPGAGWTTAISALRDRRVRTVVNPEPSRGMFSSIQVGASAVAGSPVAVLPGDMPFVRVATVRGVLDAALRTGALVSPRHGGRRGHPIVLPADVAARLPEAAATTSLGEWLRPLADRRVDIDVDDPGVVRDVDVREDLAS
jgi:molybdenum cofactor cytidylyltransferase